MAIGVGVGISLGTFRIVTGASLVLFIAVGYLIVLVQTFIAPKSIIPLAYDSGGVTTSTVTVPLVTALGLGLSATIPGRNPALDGFGLIALASLFPMITVMGYAQFAEWLRRRCQEAQEAKKRRSHAPEGAFKDVSYALRKSQLPVLSTRAGSNRPSPVRGQENDVR